jgi:X-X-X-Leu-X-X-Gly heptad repeat protein
MQAKDLLLVASGVAIGYLIFKKDLFKKKGTGLAQLTGGAGEIVSGAEQVVGGAVSTVTGAVTQLVNPKQAECEKKWDEYSQTIKVASQESLNKMKADFMSSCLLTK